MKAGNIIKRILNAGMTLGIFFVFFKGLSGITERKDAVAKYDAFYGQEEDFDVLFFGSSHILNAVFPMDLWNDYGIVSYNFGGHRNRMPLDYWQIVNALDHTDPELIVLDGAYLHLEEKVDYNSDSPHMSMDAIPLSADKIQAVQDLYAGHKMCMEYLLPFSMYHYRWTELMQDDFDINYNVEKGAESRINVAVPDNVEKIDEDDREEKNTVCITYLRKIIELCQDRDIDILLVYIPYPAGISGQRDALYLHEIAEEYEVNYIDFLNMDGIVNYNTDCYDEKSHLNPSGARKVTGYLGQYIRDHYNIPDQRNNSAYHSWYGDYDVYIDYKIGLIKEQENLKSYLMLMNDDDFSYTIEIYDPDVLLCDNAIVPLLENINIDSTKISDKGMTMVMIENDVKQKINYDYSSDELQQGSVRIIVTDNRDNSVADAVSYDLKNGTVIHEQIPEQ